MFGPLWALYRFFNTLMMLDPRPGGGAPGLHCLYKGPADEPESGKKRGGGVAIYTNNRWCNSGHITVKERVLPGHRTVSSKSLSILFDNCDIVTGVYVPPSAQTMLSPRRLCAVSSITNPVSLRTLKQH